MKRFDWDRAVEMLPQGATVAEVAAALGCSRSSVFRAVRRSPGLRERLAEQVNQARQAAGGRLHGSAEQIAEALVASAVEDRNPLVLMHLSKELQLTGWCHSRRPSFYDWPHLVKALPAKR